MMRVAYYYSSLLRAYSYVLMFLCRSTSIFAHTLDFGIARFLFCFFDCVYNMCDRGCWWWYCCATNKLHHITTTTTTTIIILAA
jgi:hypothetical protein